MIQDQATKETLSVEVSPAEHKKIESVAVLHGNTISEYVLESIRERMRRESEAQDLLKMTTSLSPVLEELWDNDKDAAYDEL
ncbi:MAG: hypothetical protein GY940_15755 [bacterium]|nr:hypothetical protein [bacterium]